VIFVDTNILLRSLQTSDPHYVIAERAVTKLRSRQETLCIAPQNLVEFWSVATRPASENGIGMSSTKVAAEITALLRLFHLLPYRGDVLQTWRRIVLEYSVLGKQAHDAHIVAMMQVHSIPAILTFNTAHFERFRGITILNPAQV
jgi:predicted nucleic acid-binding protein